MDSSELNDLSRTHVEAMLSHELTRAEAVMLASLVLARITTMGTGDKTTPAPANSTTDKTTDRNPETPFPARSAVKPPTPKAGLIIAPKGKGCMCVNCGAVVYMTNKEITDPMKIEEFIDAFEPFNHTNKIPRNAKVQNIDGSLATDCVLCNASMSLFLVGKPVKKEEKKEVVPGGYEGVQTIGQEEVGL